MKNNKISFKMNLEAKDIWWFSLYHTNKGFLGIFNLIFTLVCIYYLIATWQVLALPNKVLLILCASMFSVLQPAMLYLKALKQANTEIIKKQISIDFDDKGIKVVQGDNELEAEWDKVFKSFVRPNMIIIYFDPMRAYIIPKRYWKKDISDLRNLLKRKTRMQKF